MSNTPAIALRSVDKHYGAHSAVVDLDLAVEIGELFGFLGPNGAGKTTTLRLMLGFLRPSAGSVRLLGADMSRSAQALLVLRRVGFMPDVAGLDPAAKGGYLLDELTALQQAPALDRAHLVDALDLAPRDLERPMGRLSRGTRQKINIVQAFQHRPSLLLLDEPTEGLDPIAKRALFDLLVAAHARGATIFFSSHNLAEVEALCDRVALIKAGTLVAVDRIESLRAHMQRRVRIEFGPDPPRDIRQRLEALPTVGDVTTDGHGWRFQIADLPPLLRMLADLPVQDLTIEPPSLEDVFLQVYHGSGERRG